MTHRNLNRSHAAPERVASEPHPWHPRVMRVPYALLGVLLVVVVLVAAHVDPRVIGLVGVSGLLVSSADFLRRGDS